MAELKLQIFIDILNKRLDAYEKTISDLQHTVKNLKQENEKIKEMLKWQF